VVLNKSVGNKFRVEGMQALAKALESNKALTTLDISGVCRVLRLVL
jgi:hypothetical protein